MTYRRWDADKRVRASLANVLRPIEQASGLPNEVYVSEDFAAWEREAVLARTWACIGTAGHVPEVGDARPLEFAGLPLIMLRGRDRRIRVFHNVCSHRGMVLMDEPARLRGSIRCPYHSWTYDLDGSLRSTPLVGGPGGGSHEGFDAAEHGLRPVRAGTWFDAVFVNLSGDAPPFETFIAPLAKRWGDFDPATLRFEERDSSFVLDIACNWKLAVENYCDAYHLPCVHPGLNRYSRLQDHYGIASETGFAGQGSTAYRPQIVSEGKDLPTMPRLPARWRGAGEYVALFPNALLGIHADHFFVVRLEPRGAARTVEHVDIYYFSDIAMGDAYAPLRQANARLWRGVFEEDRYVVEGMQRGRSSPAFQGGAFLPTMDRPTHCFHRWVATMLTHAGDYGADRNRSREPRLSVGSREGDGAVC